MPSSVNDIRHHPSDSFVTFSTGATGQPQDHIPRTRTSPRRLGGTLSSHLKCLGDISACFTHTHTDTHTHLQITSAVQRQALCFTSFKLHQTKKQRKLKQIRLLFERLLKYFYVKFLYIAMTLSFVICCSCDSLMLKRGRTLKRKNNTSNNNNSIT